MSKRNLSGKIIRNAKYGATGKSYNYRVDVDESNWCYFSSEKDAEDYAGKTGGKIVKVN